MKHTILKENDFIDRFKPEKLSDGSYYRQRDWTVPRDLRAIEKAREENRLWTQVDGDNGEWCLASGWHYVNRNYYVICKVPCPAGEEFTVEDSD